MNGAALEGDLRYFLSTEVLQLIQLAQATGRLELERSEERVELFVDHGRLVFARTSGVSVRIGEVLVHRGDVLPEALELALALQQDLPGHRLGSMLVASGAASPEKVRAAINEVLRRIVYGVLLWREGRFRFVPGEVTAGDDVQIDIDLDRLILEGLRLADQARSEREPPPGD